MAELGFDHCAIRGMVTTVGGNKVVFEEEAAGMGLGENEAARLKRTMHFGSRHVVSNPATTTADLCRHSAEKLLAGLGVDAASIEGLLMVTQTPNYASPSTAIRLQHELGLPIESACFDLRLGCSGFVYGLATAYSLLNSGLDRVLLCVGDVASRMVPPSDHTITPLMGDAGSAILLERAPGRSQFSLFSDGSGERGLFIPNSGLKSEPGDEKLERYMKMDGGAVFSFTLKRIPALLETVLAAPGGRLRMSTVSYSTSPIDTF